MLQPAASSCLSSLTSPADVTVWLKHVAGLLPELCWLAGDLLVTAAAAAAWQQQHRGSSTAA